MSKWNNLKSLVDAIPGQGTIAEIASKKGVMFGAATGGSVRLADTEYMNLCLSQSSCLTTLSGSYTWSVQPSQGVSDYSLTNQFKSLSGNRPLFGSFMWYHTGPSNYWMYDTINSSNWQAIVEQHTEIYGQLFPSFDAGVGVINECIAPNGVGLRDTPFIRAAGPEFIPFVFQKARELNPNTKLFYCENMMEARGQVTRRASLLEIVDNLISLNVIDGVVLQGHLDTQYEFTGAGFSELLHELITVRGLEVKITEFDFRNSSFTDLEAFDSYASKRTYELFSISLEAGVKFFTCWDLRNDYTWLKDQAPGFTQRPLPFSEDNRPTAIERAIRAAFS